MVVTLGVSAQELSEQKSASANEIPGFKLYPNPVFDDVIYITTTQNARKEVSIYDVFGKIVLRDQISNAHINIENLDPGVYVLQVVENGSSITRKLVVK